MITTASQTGMTWLMTRPTANAPSSTPSTIGSSPPPSVDGRSRRRAIVPSTRSVKPAIASTRASEPRCPGAIEYASAGAARYARASVTWFAMPGTKQPAKATTQSQASKRPVGPGGCATDSHTQPLPRYASEKTNEVQAGRTRSGYCGFGEGSTTGGGAGGAGGTEGVCPRGGVGPHGAVGSRPALL